MRGKSCTTAQEIIETVERLSAHHYKRFTDFVPAHTQGVYVWDTEGCRYIDMMALYSAVNIGHNHPRIKRVMDGDYAIVSHRFCTPQEREALELLTQVSGMDTALFMNTGAEAFDTAVKLARKWAYTRKGVRLGDAEIIVARDNFHGRTLAATAASTVMQYIQFFGPFPPGFRWVSFGDIAALENAVTSRTAAVLLEPIQCEGGMIFPSDDYLPAVKNLCQRENVLYILDEVQTGFGRTGKMFAFEHWDAKPDVLLVGKSAGGGQYPVSAVLASREVMDVFEPGEHGSTWGGNALACAVLVESIKILQDESLVRCSVENGAYFLEKLREVESPLIRDVRGRGLLIGIELAPEAGHADEWCVRLNKEGFLCINARQTVLRLTPPLGIPRHHLDEFVLAWEKVVRAKERGEW